MAKGEKKGNYFLYVKVSAYTGIKYLKYFGKGTKPALCTLVASEEGKLSVGGTGMELEISHIFIGNF